MMTNRNFRIVVRRAMGLPAYRKKQMTKYSGTSGDDFETQEDLDRHIMEEHR